MYNVLRMQHQRISVKERIAMLFTRKQYARDYDYKHMLCVTHTFKRVYGKTIILHTSYEAIPYELGMSLEPGSINLWLGGRVVHIPAKRPEGVCPHGDSFDDCPDCRH